MSGETQLMKATYDWTNTLNKEKSQIDVIDNKLSLDQHTDDMSKNATNLLNLRRRNLNTRYEEVINSPYSIVCPRL